jgi:hypothetical protein
VVANLVCTTDSSSAKDRSITASAAWATGVVVPAVMATVGTVPPSRASNCRISVVVPDRDSTRTRS